MNFCTKCGNQLKPEARFCGKCAQVLKTDPVAGKKIYEKPIHCSGCGSAVSKGGKFCVVCGLPAVAFTIPPPIPIKQISSVPMQLPGSIINVVKPGSKHGKKKYILIPLIAILLAAGAYIVWKSRGINSFMSKSAGDGTEYTSSETVSGLSVAGTNKETLIPQGKYSSIHLPDKSGIALTAFSGDIKAAIESQDNTIDPGMPGIRTSGYILNLTLTGKGDPHLQKPVITLSRLQAGNIDPVSINMLRVSDIQQPDGTITRNQVSVLPVTIDQDGNFTATDFYFPYTAFNLPAAEADKGLFQRFAKTIIPEAHAQGANEYFEGMQWVGNVKYTLMTFQEHLNWSKNPRLVRMMPDNRQNVYRHPATEEEIKNYRKPVVNVFLLVHGHNEDEKGGDISARNNDIWEFSYKRDVWNYIYQVYQKQSAARYSRDPEGNVNDCSLFYEFIYPTYRPVFSPVPQNGSKLVVYRTLGEDLGEMINEEFLKKNARISKMIKEKIPFNLYIVSHSMGGLVARAGLRFMNGEVLANFRQLVTWGSPHQGSPLISLPYILSAGFDIRINGSTLELHDAQRNFAASQILDTPGTRDMRWTSGNSQIPKFFNFGVFFQTNSNTTQSANDLKTSSVFFNENLRVFNDNEKFVSKYTFFSGTTSRRARLNRTSYTITNIYRFYNSTPLEQGAFLIDTLAGLPMLKASDGAVPVYSQTGRGLFPFPKTLSMGDVTHEDFFGSDGVHTAEMTFEVFNKIMSCDCPTLADYTFDKGTIKGTLKLASDAKVGQRITKIKIELVNKTDKSKNEPAVNFTINPNGKFSGPLTTQKTAAKQALNLKFVFKDDSEVAFGVGEIQTGTVEPPPEPSNYGKGGPRINRILVYVQGAFDKTFSCGGYLQDQYPWISIESDYIPISSGTGSFSGSKRSGNYYVEVSGIMNEDEIVELKYKGKGFIACREQEWNIVIKNIPVNLPTDADGYASYQLRPYFQNRSTLVNMAEHVPVFTLKETSRENPQETRNLVETSWNKKVTASAMENSPMNQQSAIDIQVKR